MYDDNFDNAWEDDDSYVEEVDNTIWIESLIRRDVFEEKHWVDLGD